MFRPLLATANTVNSRGRFNRHNQYLVAPSLVPGRGGVILSHVYQAQAAVFLVDSDQLGPK